MPRLPAAFRAVLPAVLLASLLAGCAVGPDFHPPAPALPAGYTAEPLTGIDRSQRLVPSARLAADWWSLYRSPALDRLVERVLAANPDLQAAEAALRAAREATRAQQGAYLPTVGASISPSRQKVATPLSSPLQSGAGLFNLHTAQLTVGLVPDVFGANRRAVEGLAAQAEAQRWQAEGARLTLATNAVAAAVQSASLQAQIDATRRLVDAGEQQLALTRRQLELGAVPEAAVLAQQAALEQLRTTLPPLRRQLAQTRDQLAALAGGFPADAGPETFQLDGFTLPAELPLALPAQLVEQRPDVRSAQAQWQAANAQIGVATAAMLPQITLSADTGSVATRYADLFRAGTGFWTLGANLAQPLFEGGALLHRRRAAVASAEQAAAQYRSTVLSAFQNVADALEAIRNDADALAAAGRAEQASADSLAVTRRQQELGDISYLALLAAEQSYQQAVIALVQARAARLADTAALFQALGGGWWNRDPTQ